VCINVLIRAVESESTESNNPAKVLKFQQQQQQLLQQQQQYRQYQQHEQWKLSQGQIQGGDVQSTIKSQARQQIQNNTSGTSVSDSSARPDVSGSSYKSADVPGSSKKTPTLIIKKPLIRNTSNSSTNADGSPLVMSFNILFLLVHSFLFLA
jgi:hypothetical protein